MQSRAFVVTTSAQRVLGPGMVGSILQADAGNAVDVYLGSKDVTADAAATGGFRLAAGQSLPVLIDGNEDLWAVCASGAPVLRLLEGTVVAGIILGT